MTTPKFKIGERVRVERRWAIEPFMWQHEYMDKYIGTIQYIKKYGIIKMVNLIIIN